MRSKEEIVIVKKEMQQYLKCLMKQREELKRHLKNYIADSLPFPTKENPLIEVNLSYLNCNHILIGSLNISIFHSFPMKVF